MLSDIQFFLLSQCSAIGLDDTFDLPAYLYESASMRVTIVVFQKAMLAMREYLDQKTKPTDWLIVSSYQQLLYTCSDKADRQEFVDFCDGTDVLHHLNLTASEVRWLLQHGYHKQLKTHPLYLESVRQRHAHDDFTFINDEADDLPPEDGEAALTHFIEKASAKEQLTEQYRKAREHVAERRAYIDHIKYLIELSRLHKAHVVKGMLSPEDWKLLCKTVGWSTNQHLLTAPRFIPERFAEVHIIDCKNATDHKALFNRLHKLWDSADPKWLMKLVEWLCSRKMCVDVKKPLTEQRWYKLAIKVVK